MSKKPKEVIVVYGETAVHIPIEVWKNIMVNTGQMSDVWFDSAKDNQVPKSIANASYDAFQDIAVFGII